MKVLIADDHALFRDALGRLVEELDSSASVIQVSSYAQALKILKRIMRKTIKIFSIRKLASCAD